MSPLETALAAFAEQVADLVVAKLCAGQNAGFVDQTSSPLGRRRHISAVRRRVEEGSDGAAIVGRRYLLAKEALAAELAAQKPKKRAARRDDLAELRAKYGFEKRSA